MALQQATHGSICDAAVMFGNAISATVAQKASLKDETWKGSISGFAGKLYPLVKVLITLGSAAAQVRYPLLHGLILCVEFQLHSCECGITRFTHHNGGPNHIVIFGSDFRQP